MSVALDFGSSEFRTLRRQDNRLIARRIPAVYTAVENSVAHRRLLDQLHVPYSESGGSFIVIGEPAWEVAGLLSRPLIPVLHEGKIPSDDHPTRQICAWMVDSLLPPTSGEQSRCIASTACLTGQDLASIETVSFLMHLVQLRGYEFETLAQTDALALAELEDEGFTGATLSIGAEFTEFAICNLGQPVFRGSTSHGMRKIVQKLAQRKQQLVWDQQGNAYADTHRVEHWLNQGEVQVDPHRDDDENWLAQAIEEMLLASLIPVQRKLQNRHRLELRDQLPLVISGGACRLTGFEGILRESLRLAELPLVFSSIRRAAFDPYSVARGLLIHDAVEHGNPISVLQPREAA
ncbi:MAG: hypothetical protein KDA80_22170 [Planctomycetaceae bacterium]|nr:hypothetical protein [Planctomycetaceae bacterium]